MELRLGMEDQVQRKRKGQRCSIHSLRWIKVGFSLFIALSTSIEFNVRSKLGGFSPQFAGAEDSGRSHIYPGLYQAASPFGSVQSETMPAEAAQQCEKIRRTFEEERRLSPIEEDQLGDLEIECQSSHCSRNRQVREGMHGIDSRDFQVTRRANSGTAEVAVHTNVSNDGIDLHGGGRRSRSSPCWPQASCGEDDSRDHPTGGLPPQASQELLSPQQVDHGELQRQVMAPGMASEESCSYYSDDANNLPDYAYQHHSIAWTEDAWCFWQRGESIYLIPFWIEECDDTLWWQCQVQAEDGTLFSTASEHQTGGRRLGRSEARTTDHGAARLGREWGRRSGKEEGEGVCGLPLLNSSVNRADGKNRLSISSPSESVWLDWSAAFSSFCDLIPAGSRISCLSLLPCDTNFIWCLWRKIMSISSVMIVLPFAAALLLTVQLAFPSVYSELDFLDFWKAVVRFPNRTVITV